MRVQHALMLPSNISTMGYIEIISFFCILGIDILYSISTSIHTQKTHMIYAYCLSIIVHINFNIDDNFGSLIVLGEKIFKTSFVLSNYIFLSLKLKNSTLFVLGDHYRVSNSYTEISIKLNTI